MDKAKILVVGMGKEETARIVNELMAERSIPATIVVVDDEPQPTGIHGKPLTDLLKDNIPTEMKEGRMMNRLPETARPSRNTRKDRPSIPITGRRHKGKRRGK